MATVNERIEDAGRALATLKEIAAVSRPNAIERDAAIARFTYSFEAVWKATRAYLLDREGQDAASPKSAVRASHGVGLLDDAGSEAALAMANDPNMIVHLYREDLAKQVFARLAGHAETLDAWLTAMRARMTET